MRTVLGAGEELLSFQTSRWLNRWRRSFLGGGAALIQTMLRAEAFASIYKGKRFIAKYHEYANACTMLKFGMYVLESSKRPIEASAATKGTPAKLLRADAVESV